MDLIQIPSRCFELAAVCSTKVANSSIFFHLFSAKLLGILNKIYFHLLALKQKRVKTPAREIYETRDKKLNRAIFSAEISE